MHGFQFGGETNEGLGRESKRDGDKPTRTSVTNWGKEH